MNTVIEKCQIELNEISLRAKVERLKFAVRKKEIVLHSEKLENGQSIETIVKPLFIAYVEGSRLLLVQRDNGKMKVVKIENLRVKI